jgi:hypothetical protein
MKKVHNDIVLIGGIKIIFLWKILEWSSAFLPGRKEKRCLKYALIILKIFTFKFEHKYLMKEHQPLPKYYAIYFSIFILFIPVLKGPLLSLVGHDGEGACVRQTV